MKRKLHCAATVVLALSGSLHAIERLSPIQEPEVKAQASDSAQKASDQAWLGVSGQSVNPALAAQLNIPFGVTLEFVSTDGSAHKAGIKRFDIITKIGDSDIKSMLDLRKVLQQHKVGETLEIQLVSAGKAETKKVLLEGRPEHLCRASQPSPNAQAGRAVHPIFSKNQQWMDKLSDSDRQQIEQVMEQQIAQMEEHFAQFGMDMPEMQRMQQMMQEMQIDPQGVQQSSSSSYSGSFTMLDEQGSISLKVSNAGKYAEVKDQAGKVLFSGPYETEEDKAKAPADIRSRIDALGVDSQTSGNGIHLKLGK